MAREMKTRTQRRIEKKQALFMLLLMLAVSLVSFSLGVMVGKSGAPEQPLTASVEPTPEPTRMPVSEKTARKAPREPAPETPSANRMEKEQPPLVQREPLTFFDTLPKGGDQPLGSGINRPPRDEARLAPPAAPPSPTTSETAPETRAETPPERPMPSSAGEGRFVVQVASFRAEDDARKLSERLAKKDYSAFVQSADLGEKGTWYRVRIGPFANSGQARQVVDKIGREENLSAFVAGR